MAPTASPTHDSRDRTPATSSRVGPHPSYIEVAKPYILQSAIQRCLVDLAMSDAKEDAVRLQGVAYIDQVRRALQLPVRTFNTAVIYYHKFRLLHAENEYSWEGAAAAALFTACKIEDTLKKSREVLAAYYNSKVGVGEQLSSDDPRFENHSKLILGLERLMLESAGFDFRNRYPQKVMVKLARALRFHPEREAATMWNVSLDMYRTFAPLKQTTPTMAIACVELAARLHEKDTNEIVDGGICQYSKWNTTRAQIMETLLDLLDLYTHHRVNTALGPYYSLETFINIRITLNDEASAANIPRYATYVSEATASDTKATNGTKARNGINPTSPLAPLTPATPGTISPGTSQPPKSAIGIRGQSGTVRFMLDAKRAQEEKKAVDKYWVVEEEEYEVEVPSEPEIRDRPSDRDRPRDPLRDRERERDRDRERDREWDSRRVSAPMDRSIRSFKGASTIENDPGSLRSPTWSEEPNLRTRSNPARARGRGHGRGSNRGNDGGGSGGQKRSLAERITYSDDDQEDHGQVKYYNYRGRDRGNGNLRGRGGARKRGGERRRVHGAGNGRSQGRGA